MPDPQRRFEQECRDNIQAMGESAPLKEQSLDWVCATAPHKYTYNFRWLGRPIIQFPQDIVAMQELIWSVRPDLILETGIAHGGSLVFYASMLELLGGDGWVLGIDIDIRAHNREAIESHPMAKRIRMIEGSSIDDATVAQARRLAEGRERVMVVLDSNHTHDHVLAELRKYAPFVTRGSYLVVFDTIVESMPKSHFPDRPWGPGDNPWTAVQAFLKETDRFEVDRSIPDKLLITVAPDGFLRCVKD
jgi:cephalosporin hydroxylase